ncbi:MAG: alpha/beta hydrolase [Candidatus Obscuribacterales bacterium]|jgi:esterase/lipase superfamily enzyme
MQCFFVLVSLLLFIAPAAAAESYPIYWVRQTPSSANVLNTIPDEDVFNGATPESVAQFNLSASTGDSSNKITEQQFFEAIKTYAASGKPMIFFVHGCCAGEPTSLAKARMLANKCAMPVIMYRWPAFGGVGNYGDNEHVVHRCKGRAFRFLAELEAILPAQQTLLIGHSMGTRILLEALDRRSARLFKKPYQMTILAGADEEAEIFCQSIKKIALSSNLTVVFFHKEDGALFCSSQLHQQFPRLGNFGDVSFKDSEDHRMQILDVSKLTLGSANHELPYDLIGTIAKKPFAPLGFVCSKYYTTKLRNNIWSVTTKPGSKIDPKHVLTRKVKSSN